MGGTGATSAVAGKVGCAGEVSSASFTGTVPGAPTESGSLAYTDGVAQSTATFSATGASSCNGTATYCEFTLASGTLPTGLTLNTSTGVISGTPSGTATNYTFTVTATNPYGTSSASASQTLVLAAGAASQLVFTTTPGSTANGVTFSSQPVVQVEDSGGNVVTSSALRSPWPRLGNGHAGRVHHQPGHRDRRAWPRSPGVRSPAPPAHFTLSATSSGLTTATSGSFTISRDPEARLHHDTGHHQQRRGLQRPAGGQIENSSNAVVTTASAPITLSVASGSGTWPAPPTP